MPNAGFGSPSLQVSIAILNTMAGLETSSWPYAGMALAATDVAGGR